MLLEKGCDVLTIEIDIFSNLIARVKKNPTEQPSFKKDNCSKINYYDLKVLQTTKDGNKFKDKNYLGRFCLLKILNKDLKLFTVKTFGTSVPCLVISKYTEFQLFCIDASISFSI